MICATMPEKPAPCLHNVTLQRLNSKYCPEGLECGETALRVVQSIAPGFYDDNVKWKR